MTPAALVRQVGDLNDRTAILVADGRRNRLDDEERQRRADAIFREVERLVIPAQLVPDEIGTPLGVALRLLVEALGAIRDGDYDTADSKLGSSTGHLDRFP